MLIGIAALVQSCPAAPWEPGSFRPNDIPDVLSARSRSRDAFCVRALRLDRPLRTRGRREGRALAAPVARLQKETQAAVTTGLAETPGLPCAMGYGLLRALPGDRLSCPRRPRHVIASLASGSFVGAHSRTLRARTATAPRLACRDDRDAPLSSRRDAAGYSTISGNKKGKYLLKETLDRQDGNL
jgi:hypothetical protein